MEHITMQTPMREIEIFGIPALLTDRDISPDEQIPGMYCYELVSAGDCGALLGTVLTAVPVDIPESGERDVYSCDLILDVGSRMLTPAEFEEKYLSPLYGPDLEERYGKEE